jgi:predicted amidohydrolase YtcJ
VLFWEDKIGSIEEGKLADLVVLDHDILTCPLDEIKDTRVLMTMVDGEVVYERGSG